jgi:hypothetical protein
MAITNNGSTQTATSGIGTSVTRFYFVATGGENSKSGSDVNGLTLNFTIGKEQVYLNGVLLVRTVDYTTPNSGTISNLSVLSTGDVLEVIAFTSTTSSDAINISTFTAKGDLVTASSANTPARLGVGTDGQILVANSSATPGLSWIDNSVSGKNAIINGAMDFFQRSPIYVTGTITGATSGSTSSYTVTNAFSVGQYVTVAGITPSTLNASGIVTVASSSSFTINATTTGTWSSGGVATGLQYISITSNPFTYTTDRWGFQANGSNYLVSRQPTLDTSNLPNIGYCSRVQRGSGHTSTAVINFYHTVETFNSIPYSGKPIVFSFYARAGADYSSTSFALGATLITGTGTDERYDSFTGGVSAINQTATLTSNWQRFQYTATLPTSAKEIGIKFSYTPTGTASTNDYFEITGVQLETGTIASVFSRAGGSVGEELVLCQRYCQSINAMVGNSAVSNYFIMGAGVGAGTLADFPYTMKTSMRKIPLIGPYLNIQTTNGYTTNQALSSFSITGVSTAETVIFQNTGTYTLGTTYWINSTGTLPAFLSWSAEL